MTVVHPMHSSSTNANSRRSPHSLDARQSTPNSALRAVERALAALMAGPDTPALIVPDDLPQSGVRLTLPELRELLLSRGTSKTVKDAFWGCLVGLARREPEVWALGCTWLALPGLAAKNRQLSRELINVPGVSGQDIGSELVAGFLQALRESRAEVNVCARLLQSAVRSARRELDVEPLGLRARSWSEEPDRPTAIGGHPELVLLRAVRVGAISARDGDLIARTRLEAVPLNHEAQRLLSSVAAVSSRRRRAELALVRALREGLL